MWERVVRSLVWTAGLSIALLLVGAPTTALASCVLPPPLEDAIDEADAVFVGVVIEVSNRQRNAVVDVEAVWKGDVDERVEVRGGPQSPNTISSVDAAYNEGERYLFVPYEGSGDRFRDNACTSTQPYEEDFDDLRPAGASEPSPSPSPGETEVALDVDEAGDVAEPQSRSLWMVPGILALAAGGAIFLWLRRRSDGDGRVP
ncbi:MAG: hypothetical protein ACR2KQ_00485 [Actinomycetota bacterium]